jgi:predicted HTH domain antitoxin
VITKSIDLSEHEAEGLRRCAEAAGVSEGEALKQAVPRGIRALRREHAICHYRRHGDSSAAASIAGLPRAAFLQLMIDEGITMLGDDPPLAEQLENLGRSFGSERLIEMARRLSRDSE